MDKEAEDGGEVVKRGAKGQGQQGRRESNTPSGSKHPVIL